MWPRIRTRDHREQIQLAVGAGLTIEASELQVQRSNLSATLPPMSEWLIFLSYPVISAGRSSLSNQTANWDLWGKKKKHHYDVRLTLEGTGLEKNEDEHRMRHFTTIINFLSISFLVFFYLFLRQYLTKWILGLFKTFKTLKELCP